MRIDNDIKLDFDDVLIRPKRSTIPSRKNVDLIRTYQFLNSEASWAGIPIIASNMDTVGTWNMIAPLYQWGMITWLHKFVQEKHIRKIPVDYNFSWAMTVGEDYHKHTAALPDNVHMIRLDAANGYREEFVDALKKIRDIYRNAIIFAGNVCTPEMTEELLLAGADVVVVGIGPGAQCETRNKTGVGYPQLSSIIETADSAHGLKGHIAADGGCKSIGDISKAFCAGADFVVLGTMLGGHEENTDIENFRNNSDGTKEVRIYGMSSKAAMEKHYGGVADHRTSEGRESWIPYKGPVENTLKDIMGGLRSTGTYIGASSLKEFSKRTTFVRVS